MGGENSKSNQTFAAGNKFTADEISQLNETFQRIGGSQHNSSSEKAGPISKEAFTEYCREFVDDWMIDGIWNVGALKRNGTEILTLEAFHKLISALLKDDLDERIGFACKICCHDLNKSSNHNGNIYGDNILKYTRNLISSFRKSCKTYKAIKTWKESLQATNFNNLAIHLLRFLIFPCGPPKDLIVKIDETTFKSRVFTFDEVVTALTKSIHFETISDFVFAHCFEFHKELEEKISQLIPKVSLLPSSSSTFTNLDFGKLYFLNSFLPPEMKKEWRFLFSSSIHGESFSKFSESIQNKGATILIVGDGLGREFGGFCPHNLSVCPKFVGSSDAFLFHLSPYFGQYPTTGYNSNFQYFNLQQKTMPNGLGMGGTLEYFGLWIDAEYGKGYASPTCTTFASPQLSNEKDFTIAHLEAWGVGPEPEKEEEGIRKPQSVLDKDPEMRAVLELIGKKANASDGYREKPDDEN